MGMRPGMPPLQQRQMLMRQGSHPGPPQGGFQGPPPVGSSPGHQPQYGGMSPQHVQQPPQMQAQNPQMRPPSAGPVPSPTQSDQRAMTPQSPRTWGAPLAASHARPICSAFTTTSTSNDASHAISTTATTTARWGRCGTG